MQLMQGYQEDSQWRHTEGAEEGHHPSLRTEEGGQATEATLADSSMLP